MILIYLEIISEIKTMFIILSGDNIKAVNRYISNLKTKLDPNFAVFNLHEFNYNGDVTKSIPELIPEVATAGFGNNRLLVITGEIPAISKLPKKEQEVIKGKWRELKDRLLPLNTLILVAQSAPTKWLVELADKVEKFDVPSSYDTKKIEGLVKEEIKRYGNLSKIPASVITHIVNLCGNNLDLIATTVKEISILKGELPIKESEILAAFPNIDNNIFDLAKAIRDNKPSKIIEIYRNLISIGEYKTKILTVISTQLARSMRVKIGLDAQYSDEELMKFSGVSKGQLYYLKKELTDIKTVELINKRNAVFYLTKQFELSDENVLNELLRIARDKFSKPKLVTDYLDEQRNKKQKKELVKSLKKKLATAVSTFEEKIVNASEIVSQTVVIEPSEVILKNEVTEKPKPKNNVVPINKYQNRKSNTVESNSLRVFHYPKFDRQIDLSSFPVVILDPQSEDYQKHLATIAKATKLSLDIESFGESGKLGGLHPWDASIRLIQLFDGETCYITDLGERSLNSLPLFTDLANIRDARKEELHEYIAVLKDRCESLECQIIAHYAHYDTRMLATQLGIQANNISCTMLGAMVYFGDYGKGEEEAKHQKHEPVVSGGYGLKNLCKKWLGVELDKTYQTSNWGGHLVKKQIKYAAEDPISTWFLNEYLVNLYHDKTSLLYSPTIFEAWQVENNVLPVAINIECNGMPVDLEEVDRQINIIEKVQKPLLEEWSKLCPDGSYNQLEKMAVALERDYSIQLPRPKGKPSLTKAFLAKYSDNRLVQLRMKLKALEGKLNNLKGFRYSAERDGRIHTVFRTLTGFGRFSSGDSKNFKDLPNLQSIGSRFNPHIAEYKLPNPRRCIRPFSSEINTAKFSIAHELDNLPKILRLFLFSDPIKDNRFTYWFARYFLYGFAVIDLAGAHGRIGADQANDEAAIEGENDSSIDSHSKVAVFVAKAKGIEWTWDYISKLCGKYPFESEGYNEAAAKQLETEWKSKPEANTAQAFRETAKNTRYGYQNGAGGGRIQAQIAGNTGAEPPLEDCVAALEGCKTLFPGMLKHRYQLMKDLTKTMIEIDGKFCCINSITDGFRLIHHMEPKRDSEGKIIEPIVWQPPFTGALASIWTRIESTAVKRSLPKIQQLAKDNPHWCLKILNYVHDELDLEFVILYAKEVVMAVNDIIGDEFQNQLKRVKDGRETNWKKLVVNSWADK